MKKIRRIMTFVIAAALVIGSLSAGVTKVSANNTNSHSNDQHITFKYDKKVNDTSTFGPKDVKFIAVEEINGEYVPIDRSIVKKGFLVDMKKSNHVELTKENVPNLESAGYTYSHSFFYWYGSSNTSVRKTVKAIYNMGRHSDLHKEYKSDLGFSTTDNDTYTDYPNDPNASGIYAYNPTGTLRIVYTRTVVEPTPEYTYTAKFVDLNGNELKSVTLTEESFAAAKDDLTEEAVGTITLANDSRVDVTTSVSGKNPVVYTKIAESGEYSLTAFSSMGDYTENAETLTATETFIIPVSALELTAHYYVQIPSAVIDDKTGPSLDSKDQTLFVKGEPQTTTLKITLDNDKELFSAILCADSVGAKNLLTRNEQNPYNTDETNTIEAFVAAHEGTYGTTCGENSEYGIDWYVLKLESDFWHIDGKTFELQPAPTPVVDPDPTEEPNPTEEPDPTEDPDPTEEPTITEKPEEPSPSPAPSDEPEQPTPTADPTPVPQRPVDISDLPTVIDPQLIPEEVIPVEEPEVPAAEPEVAEEPEEVIEPVEEVEEPEEIEVEIPEVPEGATEEPVEEIEVEEIETPEGGEDLPQTGLTSPIVYYLMGIVILCLGAIVILRGFRRRDEI